MSLTSRTLFGTLTALFAFALVTPAYADLITSLTPLGTVTVLEDFSGFSTITDVPTSVAVSTFTTLNNLGGTVTLGPQDFSVINNGDWNPAKTAYASLSGFGSRTNGMQFVFDSPLQGVAVFMNYGFVNPAITLTAFSSTGSVLESYNLLDSSSSMIITPGGVNAGAVRGIVRPTADIKSLVISGDFVAVDDLRMALTIAGVSAAAPEPASIVLYALLSIVCLLLRKAWTRRSEGI